MSAQPQPYKAHLSPRPVLFHCRAAPFPFHPVIELQEAEACTMAYETIDVSNNPDLLRIAEAVRRRNTSAVLRNGDEAIAVVMPVGGSTRKAKRSPFKKRSQADIDAFLASAGGWKDLVDTEQLKRDIAESRARSGRPPIEL